MATKFPNLTDRPRFSQFSPVKDLTIVPFGFTVSAAGSITADDNANPPQLFATAGANNQEYVLKCPVGNPNKVWVYITCEEDIVASVTDYSTITSGELTIDLDSAPSGDTYLSGYVAYGRNIGDLAGAVAAAPGDVYPLASKGHHEVTSLLRELMVMQVGWTVDGSNVVTETRGVVGTTVAPQGSGVYDITFSHNSPRHLPENWAALFGASDGRNADFSYTTSGDRTTVTVTFANGVNMANGDRASVSLMGPVGHEYTENYGGASGGVHSNIQARDVQIYTNHKAKVITRGSTFIPFYVDIDAGTAGPDESASNLPPGFRIERASAGVYTVYIGAFEESDLIAACNLSNGTAIGVTAIDGAAGTVTITATGAADPGASGLNGFIFARLTKEP